MISPVKVGSRSSIGIARWACVAGLDDAAFGVVGCRFRAPANGEPVNLLAIDSERHGLGRLTERDRQDARRERIERAGVTDLLGKKQPLEDADGTRGRHLERLVEHQPAVRPGCLFYVGPWSCSVFLHVATNLLAVQKLVDAVHFLEGLVLAEANLGGHAQVDRLSDLAANELAVAIEGLQAQGGCPCRRAA